MQEACPCAQISRWVFTYSQRQAGVRRRCRRSPGPAPAASAQQRVQHPPQPLLRLLLPRQAPLVVGYDGAQQAVAGPQDHQQHG